MQQGVDLVKRALDAERRIGADKPSDQPADGITDCAAYAPSDCLTVARPDADAAPGNPQSTAQHNDGGAKR